MKLTLLRRRTILLPTVAGWALIVAAFCVSAAVWCLNAERFFCLNDRLPAEVLVLEAWMGAEGTSAAAAEFTRPGSHYDYIVAAGGITGAPWYARRWSYVDIATKELRRLGIPDDRILSAPTGATESQRTYETAIVVRSVLRARDIDPKALNVFTQGPHARRSRLIFAKVFGSETRVGVVCWMPPGYYTGPWWRSSPRAQDLIKETIGYLFELLLNSGRTSGTALRADGPGAGGRPAAGLPIGGNPTRRDGLQD